MTSPQINQIIRAVIQSEDNRRSQPLVVETCPRMRRKLAAAVIAAPLLALATPGTGAAADLPAGVEVNVWVDGSTIRGSMSMTTGDPEDATEEERSRFCTGPWIHTKASAERIDNAFDLDAQPERWFISQPDSIHGNDALWSGMEKPVTDIYWGKPTAESALYLAPDGEYVAGFGCGVDINGARYTSLKLIPLTVGTPTAPGANSGSTPLDFGSSGS